MKLRLLFTWVFIAFHSFAYATITLSMDFGTAYDSSGVPVSDNTLWALVVDHDTNNTFAGFGLNGSLYSANTSTPGIADDFFTHGQTISLGSVVGGGTIFAMGGGWSDGLVSPQLLLELGVNGVETGRNFAFYWFSGATFTGNQNEVQTIANQVGGIHNNTSNIGIDGFNTAMLMPSDGSNLSVGALNEDAGGSIANVNFYSITLIPEPSTAILASIGSLVLLRRRRN
jgi:hypothetical protein